METTIEKKEVTMNSDNVIIFDLFEVVFRRVASTPPQVSSAYTTAKHNWTALPSSFRVHRLVKGR